MKMANKWKSCSKCDKRKLNTLEFFGHSKGVSHSCCRICHNEMTRKWIKNNRERYYRVKYRRYDEAPALFLLNTVKQRVKKTGAKMQLTLAWIERELAKGVCSVTGVILDLKVTNKKDCRANPFRPSVDRKNNKLGYTFKNSRIVCWWYNHSKNDWTDKIVLDMAKALVLRHV